MQKFTCALLVDDDQTTNFLNQQLLKRLNLTDNIQVALNGQEAFEKLDAHCKQATAELPALLLLDIKMPVMDGFQFLEAFAELPQAQQQNVVIVMLTTSLHPQDMSRVQQLNIAGFLNKPLTKEKLLDVLDTYSTRNTVANQAASVGAQIM